MDEQVSSQVEGEIPMPISSAYVGVLHHHLHDMAHHHDGSSLIIPPPSSNNLEEQGQNGNFTQGKNDNNISNSKVVIRYRECQKNHAAAMGGNALDGCGEFMPNGEEGSLEALTCCACNCHRNFHRKEIEGSITTTSNNNNNNDHQYPFYPPPTPHSTLMTSRGRKVILGVPPVNIGGYDDHGGYGHGHGVMVMRHHQHLQQGGISGGNNGNQGVISGGGRKRFRTKFSQEQKEKMLEFAERVGWKIQKQEESVVQSFCQEIGVKRRVLKVWMHNNKHSLATNKTNLININNNDSSNNNESNDNNNNNNTHHNNNNSSSSM